MHTIDAIDAAALQSWVDALFRNLGVEEGAAAATADSLVDADLRGIGTHGGERWTQLLGEDARRVRFVAGDIADLFPDWRATPLADGLARTLAFHGAPLAASAL
ncbi:MAG: hypothetical protein H0W83_03100 [Planctomycetes bacterium]|nr:hypothetical protein [Planctomycetota bacterium]